MRRTVFLAILLGSLALAQGAGATPTWSARLPPAAQAPNGVFNAISCSSSTTCEAIGSAYNAEGRRWLVAAGTNGSTSWTNQPIGVPGGATYVTPRALSCFSGGCVVVGDGSTGSFAESYNGTSWSMLSSAPNLFGASGLYCKSLTSCSAAGGSLENYDGSGWTFVAVPAPSGRYVELTGVSGVCSSGNTCEVIGSSYPSGGGFSSARPYAAKWNGSSWTTQTINPWLNAFGGTYLTNLSCGSSSSCLAVGYYVDNRNRNLPMAEYWNGSTWTAEGVPAPSGVSGVYLNSVSCGSATSCWALGNNGNFTERWNGSSFTLGPAVQAPGGLYGFASGISCGAASTCMVAGFKDMGMLQTLAESWNGSSWGSQTTPNMTGATDSGLNAVSCGTSTTCMGVGEYLNGSTDRIGSLAEIYNGSFWTSSLPLNPSTSFDTELNGTSCTSATTCYAVGFASESSGLSTAVAELASGSTPTWSNLTAVSPGSDAALNGVSCVTGFCLAVGQYVNSSGQTVPLAETLKGTSTTWSPVTVTPPSGAVYMTLNGVKCLSATSCEVVGSWTNSSDISSTFAASFNGSAFTPQTTASVGSPFGNSLNGVSCTAANNCTAVGAQGYSSALVEHWNGSSWALQTPAFPPGVYDASFSNVACASGAIAGGTTTCEGVGNSTGAFAEGLTGGTWASQPLGSVFNAFPASLPGVSCTTSSCQAVGAVLDESSLYGFAGTAAKKAARTSGSATTTTSPSLLAAAGGHVGTGVPTSVRSRFLKGAPKPAAGPSALPASVSSYLYDELAMPLAEQYK